VIPHSGVIPAEAAVFVIPAEAAVFVIPAKAGIQFPRDRTDAVSFLNERFQSTDQRDFTQKRFVCIRFIPASAGMTAARE